MRDITDILLEYREAKRHLWNTYFLGRVHSLRDCGALDHYEQIDRHLFYALVLEELNMGSHEIKVFREEPLTFLKIVPRDGQGDVPLIVGETGEGRNRVWNDQTPLLASGFELEFIEFFEWDRYGDVSFPYLRGRIVALPKHTDLIGRECLVETHRANVMFTG